MKLECPDCIHDKVCGLKDAYAEVKKSTRCDQILGASFVSVIAQCDHFLPTSMREGGFGYRKPDYIIKSDAAKERDREEIESMKKSSSAGRAMAASSSPPRGF